jgi:HPt (histidine-containing phosphotransfer) domain-containing protein
MDQAVQAAPETSPPVDLQHLARYTLGNRALDIEILGLFLAQAPATIARLAAADDHQQWREAAHTLKGSARGVGAWRLGDMAQAAERSAAWDDPGARSATIAQLRQALAAAEAFIGGLA